MKQTLTQSRLDHIEEIITNLYKHQKSADTVSFYLSQLGSFLQESETKLIKLMNNQKPPNSEPGNVEFGPALYLLNHIGLSSTTLKYLKELLGIPNSQITTAEFNQWSTEILAGAGVVGDEGELISLTKYAVFDPEWIYSLALYLLHLIEPKAPFNTNPATIQLSGQSTLRIAIIGDWGTGNWTDGEQPSSPAVAVFNQIKTLNPDYIIHLGDVYYSGTDTEEQTKFVTLWEKNGFQNKVFTLNSNHEMYSGAKGYFNVALNNPICARQQNTSYFALEIENYIFIGLDSSYYDKSWLYFKGELTDSHQTDFIRGLNTTGKKVIILTHHNGLDITGQNKTKLWGQVNAALGRDPDWWYWGHLHNGIAYSSQSQAGATKARCIGNSSIPYGDAYSLYDASGNLLNSVSYTFNTKMPNPTLQQKNRILNGFALLTLQAGSMTEEFYDQRGNRIWSERTAS